MFKQTNCYAAFQGRRQRKMTGGNKTKKIETYNYNFCSLWHTKCSIIFSMPKAWCTPAIITRTSKGVWGQSPSVWRFLQFLMEITHF